MAQPKEKFSPYDRYLLGSIIIAAICAVVWIGTVKVTRGEKDPFVLLLIALVVLALAAIVAGFHWLNERLQNKPAQVVKDPRDQSWNDFD